MEKRIALDLESTGFLDNSNIDYTKLPFKLKPHFKVHCLVGEDLVTGEVRKFRPQDLKDLKEYLTGVTEIIGHNIIDYDLPVMQLYFGLDFTVGLVDDKDTFMGQPCKITDTMVWSKLLNPDRLGGHSLKAWGKKLGILKGAYGEETEAAWDAYSENMLDYCEQDVKVTVATYHALMKEASNWDWSEGYQVEKATRYLVSRGEHVGFHFDVPLAEKCVKELNDWMAAIKEDVEPKLPMKRMGKTAQKAYIPPTNQLKENGDLTSHMANFLFKHDIDCKKVEAKHQVAFKGEVYTLPLRETLVEASPLPKVQQKKDGSPSKALEKYLEEVGASYERVPAKYTITYKGVSKELPLPEGEPIEDREPMLLEHQTEMKEWLVSSGWKPSEWRDSDLTLDSKKKKVSPERFKERVKAYCVATNRSHFAKDRLEHLKALSVKDAYYKMLKHDLTKPLKVLTSPKYTVGQEKDICPNLVKLGEQVSFIEDVVKWLTYRHRRNSILSPNGTGFLAHVRADNSIATGADSCGAATSRFQHRVVCNIPRVTTLYGDKMRALFGVPEDFYQVGYDFSSLEARVEAHYTSKFEGGDIYGAALTSEKPHDIHTMSAAAMGITRDAAKTIKYAISYGAQAAKISKQMDWPLQKARQVFEDFWENALPLKLLKEYVTNYWKKTGKKYIVGIDGRKLYIRSEHSILNMLFQSAGVIAAKKANAMHNQFMMDKGILLDPFKDKSWYGKAHVMILYHKLVVA